MAGWLDVPRNNVCTKLWDVGGSGVCGSGGGPDRLHGENGVELVLGLYKAAHTQAQTMCVVLPWQLFQPQNQAKLPPATVCAL